MRFPIQPLAGRLGRDRIHGEIEACLLDAAGATDGLVFGQHIGAACAESIQSTALDQMRRLFGLEVNPQQQIAQAVKGTLPALCDDFSHCQAAQISYLAEAHP